MQVLSGKTVNLNKKKEKVKILFLSDTQIESVTVNIYRSANKNFPWTSTVDWEYDMCHNDIPMIY